MIPRNLPYYVIIRKDYVQGEMRHQKAPIWPDTWKFLSGKYKDVRITTVCFINYINMIL